MTLIRCRAGGTVGLGHLVRCRVLADLLLTRGRKPILVGPPSNLQTIADQNRFQDWIERPDWHSAQSEARYHLRLAAKSSSQEIILDDYRSDGLHQKLLREGGLRCLQQYDASKPQSFAAQLVVNSSPFERREIYEKGFLCDDVEMLLGPEFAILRPEFSQLKPRPFTPDVTQILITFGGGDDRGTILTVLRALAHKIPSDTVIKVMVGGSHPNPKLVQDAIDTHGWTMVELCIDPSRPFDLINESDLAILAGGTTTFEAAKCGIPMVLIPIAPNQYNQCVGWENRGAAICLSRSESVTDEEISNAVTSLIEHVETRKRMSQAGRESVDGLGAERMIDRLLKHSN